MLATVEETTLEELCEAHLYLRVGIVNDLQWLTPQVYFAPQNKHWSPAEHVDHLTRCDQALLRALRGPRLSLRLRFGRAPRVSRPNDELLGNYLGKLAAGAGARGRSRPELPPAEERTETRQQQMLTGFRWLDQLLVGKLALWEDEELDHFRLRHPILGRLTIREHLALSLYHNRHHHRRILERLETEGDSGRCDEAGLMGGPPRV